MWERILVLCAGYLLDLLLGDPQFWWHPVRGVGKVIEYTEKLIRRIFKLGQDKEADKRKKQLSGVLLAAIVLTFTMGCCILLLYGAGKIHPALRIGLEILLCYQMLAQKSLKVESMKVYKHLVRQDVEGARYAVSMIVGRDTDRLDEQGITRAAVETVAENTSDGVIAPMIFMLIFGVPGGVFYKTVNTMDSMIGYKNDRYCYLGTAAARLDDICNFIPARISALYMIVSAFLLGMDGKNAFRIFCRDRYNHASPNSAQTEAACAGALDVRLAGDAWYFGVLKKKPYIGDPVREIEPEDIRRVNRLMYLTGLLVFVTGVAVLAVIGVYMNCR